MAELETTLNRLWRFVRTIAKRFFDDRCTRVAGALAFTTVLSLVPLTAVSFAMLSVFPVFETWTSSLQGFMQDNFAPAVGEATIAYVQEFATNAGKLTTIGLIFLFVTSIMLMATIEDAFNDIWHVSVRRKWRHRFTAYWAVITLGPLLVGLSLSTTSYLASMSSTPLQSKSLWQVALFGAVPVLFEWVMFLLLYVVVPNCRVRLGHALAGASVAVVLFEIAKRFFGGFIVSSATYREVYGAVAVLPVFLIWIYASWVITLLGAVVTATLTDVPALGPAPSVKRTVRGTGSARKRK